MLFPYLPRLPVESLNVSVITIGCLRFNGYFQGGREDSVEHWKRRARSNRCWPENSLAKSPPEVASLVACAQQAVALSPAQPGFWPPRACAPRSNDALGVLANRAEPANYRHLISAGLAHRPHQRRTFHTKSAGLACGTNEQHVPTEPRASWRYKIQAKQTTNSPEDSKFKLQLP